MGKVKLNLVSGAVVEKPLICAFKASNNEYIVFDDEMNGSMGLPIILVCKYVDNKVTKILDQNEWQTVKEYLKNIIAGSPMEFVAIGSELVADDIYYTQLTLPVTSFDALKNAYKVDALSSSVPPVNNNQEEVGIMDINLNNTPLPQAPEMPASPTPVTQVEPAQVTPVEANVINPTPEINPTKVSPIEPNPTPEMPVPPIEPTVAPASPTVASEPAPAVPEIQIPIIENVQNEAPVTSAVESPVTQDSGVSSTPQIPEMPQAPQVVEPVINNEPTPVPNVEPAKEVNNLNTPTIPTPEAVTTPVNNPQVASPAETPTYEAGSLNPTPEAEPVEPPVPTVTTVLNNSDAKFKEQKEAFMQACENMFDALVQKFEKELENSKQS